MPIADTSQTRLAFVAETTEGTTPTSPGFQTLRYTSESLTRAAEKITSDEITPHRNVTDLILVGRMASGNIRGELSYGTYDALLEAVMCGTWTTNVLKNAAARKSFTFEKTFEQGSTDTFIRYTGCLIDTLQMDITSKGIALVDFGVMGRGGSSGVAALSGATYASPNSNPVLNASSHVGTLTVSGVSPAPVIKSLSLNIANNLREQSAVGSLEMAGVGLGRFDVTGSMEVYFESVAMYNAIHNNTSLGITFTIGAASGSKYTFNLPNVRVTGGEPVAGGNNQDVMLPLEFRAIYSTAGSPANNASMIITRAVS